MKTILYRITPLLALAVFAGGTTTLRSAPVLIDEFVNDLAPTTANTFLDGVMLGGELDISLTFLDAATVEIENGTLTLSGVTETGGANNAQFVYDGDDDTVIYSYGLPSIDFTDGGSNDRFTIDLSSVTGTIDVLVQVREDSGNFSFLTVSNVTSAGILEFPFADFSTGGAGADFAAANQVAFWVYLDTGEEFSVDSFQATAAPTPPPPPPSSFVTPDTTRPTVGFLKKRRLKTPRARQTLKGTASDNGGVEKVEVKTRGKSWRKGKLKPTGKWNFRTPRLKAGKNRIKVRAIDSSGNRSPVKKITAQGVSGLDPGSSR